MQGACQPNLSIIKYNIQPAGGGKGDIINVLGISSYILLPYKSTMFSSIYYPYYSVKGVFDFPIFEKKWGGMGADRRDAPFFRKWGFMAPGPRSPPFPAEARKSPRHLSASGAIR